MSYINTHRHGEKVLIWERLKSGERIVKDIPCEWYFFSDSDNPTDYKNIYGQYVKRHNFSNKKDFDKKREHLSSYKRLYESDIAPELKALSKFYYNKPAPNLHLSAYDIEVDYDPEIGFPRPVTEFDPNDYQDDFERIANTPYAPINSISIYNFWENKNHIIAIPPNNINPDNIDIKQFKEKIEEIEPLNLPTSLEFFDNERGLLIKFLEIIDDSDIVFGWNSDTFDNPYIAQRIQIVLGNQYFKKLSFQETHAPKYASIEVYGESRAIIQAYGRILTDYLEIYKKFSFGEKSSYKLESIAEEELPSMRKLEYSGSLYELYRNDFEKFIRYNIRDTEILHAFEEKLGFIQLANTLYHKTTGLFKHVFGTLKNTELALINYCHHELDNIIVPDTHPSDSTDRIEGAYVLDPKIGQHDFIASIDIASLYPSAIRSNNISPDTIIGQFSNTKEDFQHIKQKSNELLTLNFDKSFSNSEPLVLEAYKFELLFKKWKWSISGYGTVFNQEKPGILPSLLESWYIERKKTKKKSFEYAKKAEKILEKYK